MPRERVECQLLANQPGQAINRPPQIGCAGREIGTDGCSFGFAPISLADSHVCSDPIQPLPPGTNTWLFGPVQPYAFCPAGSSSLRPFTPTGSDWCNDLVVLDSNLVPTIQAAARNACGITETGATRCGFNEADYDAVIYASPYRGVAGVYVGGKTIFTEATSRSTSMYTFTHELGHFFGLSHAQSWVCGSSTQRVAYDSENNCTVLDDYGDPSSVMARIAWQMSGYEKLAIGAIAPASLQTVSTSGQYFVAKTEEPSASPRVLRIRTGGMYPGSSMHGYYYLDYRQPLLYDSGMASSPWVNGVSVHLAPDYSRRFTAAGAANTRCGASCSSYSYVASAKLLDMTPVNADNFGDAPLAVGASFTEPVQGITMQVASKDSSGATVDVTFTPANKKLFFYQPSSGSAYTYWQYASGGIQYVSGLSGASPSWTHVVGANNGGLLWYNASSGPAYTAFVDDLGRYRSRGAISLAAGWTHIASVGRGNLVFYRAGSGTFATATLGPDGLYTQKSRGSGWDTDWSIVVGTLNGGLVLYKSWNGMLTTAKLDGAGTFSNWQTLPAATNNYTHAASAREGGLVFYNRATGAVRTAVLDDAGVVTWKTNAAWGFFSEIVGGLNGALFLYRASDGYSFTVTMDRSYNLRAVGSLTGIGPGQILASAGGI